MCPGMSSFRFKKKNGTREFIGGGGRDWLSLVVPSFVSEGTDIREEEGGFTSIRHPPPGSCWLGVVVIQTSQGEG